MILYNYCLFNINSFCPFFCTFFIIILYTTYIPIIDSRLTLMLIYPSVNQTRKLRKQLCTLNTKTRNFSPLPFFYTITQNPWTLVRLLIWFFYCDFKKIGQRAQTARKIIQDTLFIQTERSKIVMHAQGQGFVTICRVLLSIHTNPEKSGLHSKPGKV